MSESVITMEVIVVMLKTPCCLVMEYVMEEFTILGHVGTYHYYVRISPPCMMCDTKMYRLIYLFNCINRYDGGDCKWFRDTYPNCEIDTIAQLISDDNKIVVIGDGVCDGGAYKVATCGFEAGDCSDCANKVSDLTKIGDGQCDGGDYNSQECDYDGQDCVEFNELYPNCDVPHPWKVGNGQCDGGAYYSELCGWDGGDCVACNAPLMQKVGNGFCDGRCVNAYFSYVFPQSLTNAFVNRNYMTVACGNDGGDCDSCMVTNSNFIGDGKCQGNG